VWDALVIWLGNQAKGVQRHVDGSYIKPHQHGLLCDFVLCAGNFHDLTAHV